MFRTLLRIVIPSWRFFDQTGSFCRVQYRDQENPDWLDLFSKRQPLIGNILLNPQGNLQMAAQSQVDQLALRIQEDPDFKNSVGYRLIQYWVRQKAKGRFQFRLNVLTPKISEKWEELYLSEWET